MALYVGFYWVTDDFNREVWQKLRSGAMKLGPGEIPEPLAAKVRESVQKKPAGLEFVGSWFPLHGPAMRDEPGVAIVETNDVNHLAWLASYYDGFLEFRFRPYLGVRRG